MSGKVRTTRRHVANYTCRCDERKDRVLATFFAVFSFFLLLSGHDGALGSYHARADSEVVVVVFVVEVEVVACVCFFCN